MPRPRPELVSVVVPVRNEEVHVADQLAGLASQTYRAPWEVVVVDNGCTDRTIEIVRGFADRLPALTVADASTRRGLNHARNVGAASAHGDLLAFCDGNDVVTVAWLERLVEAATGADLVGGPFDEEALNDDWARGGLAPERLDELLVAHGFLPIVPGGNCAVWTAVARAVPRDESFVFGSCDVEFSWRVQLAGHTIGFAPGAVVLRRHAPELARKNFVYGWSAALLYRRFRGRGMGRNVGQALADWRWLARNAPGAVRRRKTRATWLRLAGRRTGRLAGSVRRGVFFP